MGSLSHCGIATAREVGDGMDSKGVLRAWRLSRRIECRGLLTQRSHGEFGGKSECGVGSDRRTICSLRTDVPACAEPRCYEITDNVHNLGIFDKRRDNHVWLSIHMRKILLVCEFHKLYGKMFHHSLWTWVEQRRSLSWKYPDDYR